MYEKLLAEAKLADNLQRQLNLSANHKEKAKGLEVTRELKVERGGRATVSVIDQGQETKEFWEALGGEGLIGDASPDDADDAPMPTGAAKLIRLSEPEEGGQLQTTQVATGNLNREMLDPKDVFLLDNEAEARLAPLK